MVSLDIAQNWDMSISNVWISGQSLINEKCRNSRTSNDADMKLGPVTKLDRRKVIIDHDIMSTNYDIIVNFLIGQYRAKWKSHSRCMSVILTFSNSSYFSYKNWKHNLQISNTALILLLWVKVVFFWKKWLFAKKKNADISKIKGGN